MPANYEPVTSAEAKAIQGPRPGARALSDVILLHYMSRGIKTGGIYNSRKVRGSLTSWSTHAAGRGIDFMVPTEQLGDELYLRLIAASDATGVGEVIWQHYRWTGQKGQQHYKPSNHMDHVHCSMTIDMASHPYTEDLKKWFAHFLFK